MIVDLEKAFYYIPHKILLWEMRTLVVGECVISTTSIFYSFASTQVRVNDKFSEEFGV